MENLGTKYQLYVDDELIVLRLLNIKSENKFVMIDKDKKRISMTKEELSKCVKLEPDAMLNIMTTTSSDGLRDVYACVNKIEDLKNGITVPSLILRQDIYSSSKNALNGLTKTLALELAKDNILVNEIAPGYVMTEMTKKNLSSKDIEMIENRIPTGRLQTKEDIAFLTGFLCSEQNQSITGQLIAVDGGYLCR